MLHVPPLLAPQIKAPRQFARQQLPVAGRHVAQRRQEARHLIQGHLVEGDHFRGKGRQIAERIRRQPRGQQGTDLGEQLLKRRSARLRQPLVDRLICDRKARVRPETALADQAPQGQLAAHAAQHADQQAGPQAQRGQHPRPTRSGSTPFREIRFQLAQRSLQKGLDITEHRVGLSVQR